MWVNLAAQEETRVLDYEGPCCANCEVLKSTGAAPGNRDVRMVSTNRFIVFTVTDGDATHFSGRVDPNTHILTPSPCRQGEGLADNGWQMVPPVPVLQFPGGGPVPFFWRFGALY